MPRGNERPTSEALAAYLDQLDRLDLAYSLIRAAGLQWDEYDAGFLAAQNIARS